MDQKEKRRTEDASERKLTDRTLNVTSHLLNQLLVERSRVSRGSNQDGGFLSVDGEGGGLASKGDASTQLASSRGKEEGDSNVPPA